MRTSGTNLVLAIGLVVIGVALGVALIMYSEADDAPGGIVFGMLLIGGAVALGVRMAQRKT